MDIIEEGFIIMKFKCLGLMLIVLLSVLSLSFAQDHPTLVRLIYFFPREFPSNYVPMKDVDARMDQLIKGVQQFYAEHMENHGFGRKTFQIETDAHGKAVVHHVKGKFAASYYNREERYEANNRVRSEIREQFDMSQNFYYLVLSDSIKLSPSVAGSIAISWFDWSPSFEVTVAAHELGHLFGLSHDPERTDGIWIPSLGISDAMITSFCAAEWLDVHRAFNPGQATVNTGKSTIKMLPPSLAAPPNAIRLRFEVTNPDGIHQVQLRKSNPVAYYGEALMDCQKLNGSRSDTINFITTGLLPTNTVQLSIIDSHGNTTFTQPFTIDIKDLLPSSEVVSIRDRNLAASVRNALGLGLMTCSRRI